MGMNRPCKLLLAPVSVCLACFFLFVARHRFIDADEGCYLMASRLVLEHKVPYRDFLLHPDSSAAVRIWHLDEAVRNILVLRP